MISTKTKEVFMKSLKDQIAIYRKQHTNKINLLTHYIGIPAIIFSLLMFLNWISIDVATKVQISFSWIAVIAILVYYFSLNVRLAAAAAVVLIVMAVMATLLARPTPTLFSTLLFLILFFGGWALQFIGHYFEKQKPAFLISVKQLLIGPLFVLTEAIEALGLTQYIK